MIPRGLVGGSGSGLPSAALIFLSAALFASRSRHLTDKAISSSNVSIIFGASPSAGNAGSCVCWHWSAADESAVGGDAWQGFGPGWSIWAMSDIIPYDTQILPG